MNHVMEDLPIGATVLSPTQGSTVKQVSNMFDSPNWSMAKDKKGYNINVTLIQM